MRRLANFAGSEAAAALLIFLQPSTSSSFSLDRPSRVTATWSAIDHDSDSCRKPRIDPPRSGHVAFSADGAPATRPYVFGGYCEVADEGTVTRFASDELWGWLGEHDSGGWEKVGDQNGEVPGPRLASAAAVLGGRTYIFGGWDPQTPGTGGVILDTVHRLDLSTHTWTKLSATVPGGPTSRHVVLALPGGIEALVHNHRCTDHVLVFDSSTEKFRQQQTSGEAPSSRGLHCAVMCGRNAVLFGGAAQSGTMSNEAFLLDTDSWKWTKLQFETSVDAPSPRAASCLCSVSPNCALVFGGAETTESGLNGRADLWALHFDTEQGIGRWELLISDDSGKKGGAVVPPPRNAATLTKMEAPGKGSQKFLLQGGWAPFKTTWGDSYLLNIQINE